MFKNRFLIVLGVTFMLLVTMAISRPFSSPSVPSIEDANDFYQRHRNWNRNLEGSDYYERHTNPSASASSIADLSGDIALRHPEWSLNISNSVIPVTDIFEGSDYFQRHPELSLPVPLTSATDLSDYFVRHPELRTPGTTIDLSDYFQRH